VQADGQAVFEGTLTQLQAGAAGAFRIPSHATAEISVLAWIPAAADEGTWKARSNQIQIEFLTTPTTS
jgi:hypothetical protein